MNRNRHHAKHHQKPRTLSKVCTSPCRRERHYYCNKATRHPKSVTTPKTTRQIDEPRRYCARRLSRRHAEPQWSGPWILHVPAYPKQDHPSYGPQYPTSWSLPTTNQPRRTPPQALPTRAQPILNQHDHRRRPPQPCPTTPWN